jgi:Na+-translocating ferredoxin:NAD+ oxidoreductase RnfC subunit
MGSLIDWQKASVTKTTKAILILPNDIPAVTAKMGDTRRQIDRASSVCCQCTLCTEMCPRALIGYNLTPHRTVRNVASTVIDHPEEFLSASACCGCGVCDLVACCQGILPRKVMMEVREAVGRNKLKYHQEEPIVPDPDRDSRLLPNKRFKALIGVAPFDKMVAQMRELAWQPQRVVLPLKQHVGAPASPMVRVGDDVREGDRIAQAAPGISANIHASITGRVTVVGERSITIERT